MSNKLKGFALVCVILLSGYVHYQSLLVLAAPPNDPHARQGKVPPNPIPVACSPDKPVVSPRETISVRAWATSRTGQSLRYTWSATAGRVAGQGSEVRWNFKGVRPGIYKATVRVNDPRGEVADCSVRVIVRSRPIQLRGGKRETGRAFLLPDETETKGYGLYSYFLLGSPPSDATRERYLKAIIEYLKFPDVIELEKNIRRYHRISSKEARRKLNITYLPIRDAPRQEILEKLKPDDYTEVAEWVLGHYNYARARVLLSSLAGDHRGGPYIVSFLKPQSGHSLSPPYLYQDQSWVPPHLVALWMKEFLNQAAQERFWEERTGKKLVLNLRTTVGILAIGLPEVRKALDDWIAWIG